MSEFLISDERPDLAKLSEHHFTLDKKERITLLVQSVLQPTRTEFSSSFRILSGFRSPDLNQAIGGSRNSDHLLGAAVDFSSDNLEGIYYWMYHNKLPFRQLIYYPDQKFIHASINIPGLMFKNQALIKYNGDPTYHKFCGSRLIK